MKKFIIEAVLLIIVIAVALFIYLQGSNITNLPFAPQPAVYKQLDINNNTFKVEIADTKAKRNQGLGGRQSLAPNEGMLFIFDTPGKPPFWMKGLSFPLDFIWIKGDTVVDLTINVQPPASGQSDSSLPIYQPKEDIDKVLEVNGGTIQRLNIKAGDTINIHD